MEDIADPVARIPFRGNKLNAERLVKLDMPELELHPDQANVIEVHQGDSDTWRRAVIEKFSVDGRCRLRWSDDQALTEWADLSRLRYRWVATRAVPVSSPPLSPPPPDADAPAL